MNEEDGFDLSQKARSLTTKISSFKNCKEPGLILEHVKEAIEDLVLCTISEAEDILKHVAPVIRETVQEIYAKNNLLVESNDEHVLDAIKSNIQVALHFIDICYQVLDHVTKYNTINFKEISSLPTNIAQIISSTFGHCKYSQATYSAFYKCVSEIVDVFRKTQELHTKFLNFLDRHLTFDFLNENDVSAYTEILDVILEISKTLLGVNMKSMSDNWKTFVVLAQRHTKNVSPAIQLLTGEIDNNLKIISELEIGDSNKAIQLFKITGFLVKVVLKLFECEFDILECYDEVLRFWLMIYSWHACKFSEEFFESYNTIATLCTESLLNFILHYNVFLKKFSTVIEKEDVITKNSFGVLIFATILIKELHFQKILDEHEIVSLISLIFNLTKNCFEEYFFDNSNFYEELITSVAIAILLFPNVYLELEKLLLECVLQEKIWTTLIATDVWCLVLRHSSEGTCRSVFRVLINQMLELEFYSSTIIVHLKVFTQRIFKMLPVDIQIEELVKYDPNNISVWKIISTRNIPLSHRYYIEFILSDLDKTSQMNKEYYSVNDFMFLMETLDVVSYTNFHLLEINAERLVPMLMKLWSFDLSEVSPGNKSLSFFIQKLLKITTVVGEELTVENLILILNHLKPAVNDFLVQLLICDFLRSISGRNFNSSLKKVSLFSLIIDVFLTLVGSKNAVVVQTALECFTEFSNKENYGCVIQKVSTSSEFVKKLVNDYVQRSSVNKYDLKYFQRIRNNNNIFRHHGFCLDTFEEPSCKKIKLESDLIIECLKNDTEKLIKMQLNSTQMTEIRRVEQKLQTLLK
ncbi:FIGNL1-interacting regulator of recombination and mitosis [Tribolium castaneum]|uniref:Uncharacterized protein n=1 Tax=Tribolium castaneum TaxID=7070 RepID=A0A139WFJ2_TRICA|nr:PREDICTED: uncharacterized protein C1orf112 homolog [Tribolium castaneum]KYB26768.1 hypothetical protein TcasGA2_TC033553 [Tribolium castaneum]|eukprot:XP_008195231.1 PREDICTED: uncharacterized protein C1orf112 homolog [Tribolium castaneum]